MEILLIIVSIVLIALVLLQSNKASEAGQIITGGNSMLMGQMKERGAEKFITRLTYATGFLFIILSMIMGL
ncbi:protein-export translocase membrane protein [Clostridium sp. CAG:628]|jgi:preprotein translocase subunit SecG|nr:protein-export translocase membrane protein [Clostridium sp. CAG:628]